MNTEKCEICGRYTAIIIRGTSTAMCMNCQDEMGFKQYHGNKPYEYDKYGSRSRLADQRKAEREQMMRYESPMDALKRKKAEERRKKDAQILRAKQARCLSADQGRECAGCEMTGLIDPDDYLCIVCRDGKEAVAPGYLHYWKRMPEEVAA